MEMFGKVETLAAISRAGVPRIELVKNTGSGASKSLNPNKVYVNSQQVFINDGTSGGTTIANQTVLANQNGMLIRQTNLHTGETLRRAINPAGDIFYSYSSYSSVANPALLQIGRTTGQNLLPTPSSPIKGISYTEIPKLYYDVSVGMEKTGSIYDANGYLTRPIYGGVTVIGAGTNPVKGAYNIDIYPNPNIGVYYGNANNLNNIMNGTQSRVIAENPYGYSPYNREINNILQTGGVLRTTGTESNKFFNRGYDVLTKTNQIGYREIVNEARIPVGYIEILRVGEIPETQRIQGYQGNGGTGNKLGNGK